MILSLRFADRKTMLNCLSSAASTTSSNLLTASPVNGRINRASFISHQIKNGVLRFQVPNSRQNLLHYPLVASSSSSSNLQFQSPNQDESGRMVHVILQLHKECEFGDQFLVSGHHPRLGSWIPLDALPMTWSDGHVWTAEIDLPVGELIEFKFILKEISGEILWQPGPNRVIQTQETSRAVSVFGDWENEAFQQVIKMHENQKQESFNGQETTMVALADNIESETTSNDVEVDTSAKTTTATKLCQPKTKKSKKKKKKNKRTKRTKK